MISAICNVGAILLGLSSWACGAKAVGNHQRGMRWILASLLCCAAALLLQILEVAHRTAIGDMSAVMDTIGAVAGAAGILVLISAALNILAYRSYQKT